MSTQLERLALELLGLPDSTRALLAKKLVESLDEIDTPDIRSLWAAIARHKAQYLEKKSLQGIPADEVMQRAKEILQ
jgi:hypothetical protein